MLGEFVPSDFDDVYVCSSDYEAGKYMGSEGCMVKREKSKTEAKKLYFV